jgi:hypothetical protein
LQEVYSYLPIHSQQFPRKILVDGNALKHRSDNNHSLDTLATLLGFQPLPLSFMLVLGALGAACVTAAENVKRVFSILVKFYLSRRSTYEFRQTFLLFRAIIGFSKLATRDCRARDRRSLYLTPNVLFDTNL